MGLVWGLGLSLYLWLVGATTLWGKPAVLHGMTAVAVVAKHLTPPPWQFVAFLETMTGHLLVDRLGGAYRFKHDLLQKHVAQLEDAFISSLSSKP